MAKLVIHPAMTRTSAIIVAASVPLIVLAFWPMYLARPFASIDPYTHLHALAGVLWVALLIAQPLAIHYRRLALHRALGRTSYVIAPLFVIAGGLLSHHRLSKMSEATFATEGYSHYLPFYASIVFGVAWALGIRYRRLREVHARFMLLTAMPLIDPVIGRVLFFYFPPLPNQWIYSALTFGLASIIAALLVFSYRAQPAARRALVGYFVFFLAMEVGWFTLALTAPWLSAVRWFRALPLT